MEFKSSREALDAYRLATGLPVFQDSHPTSNTGGEPSFLTIARWIQRCKSQHKECRESGSQWLPTRLIDVYRYEEGIIHLVETSKLSKGPCSYVSLSHCWGKKQFLVTTPDTKAKFEAGVKTSELPPNFRDAIYATWNLGFRYIWIDSLCIIQKSPDWLKEAPLMNKVYRNSALTLAAAASPDAFGGLFKDRDLAIIAPHEISVQMSPDTTAPTNCVLVPDSFRVAATTEAPLYTRAWVVQERALSPRTVNFCDGQIFWDCRELEACETFPDGIPQIFSETMRPGYETNGFKGWESAVARVRLAGEPGGGASPETTAKDMDYKSVYEVWEMILRNYARCNLTQPSDRFVAISGVVREFEDLLGDEYLAGLWRRNFINGLLWHVSELRDDSAIGTSRPPGYRAPTWSWASIDTHPIDMPIVYQLESDYAEVVDISIKPKAADPYGEIAEGRITVQGYLVKIRKPTIFRMSAKSIFGQFFPDVDEEIGDDQLFALPLREDRPSDNAEPDALWGLVLALVSPTDHGNHKDTYRRVGVFWLPGGDPLRFVGQMKPGNVDPGVDYRWFDNGMEKSVFTLI